MSQVLRRAAADNAAKLRLEPSPEPPRPREGRSLGLLKRGEPRASVLRPINLERRARFARIADDEPPSDA
jgi:hypothetical protein